MHIERGAGLLYICTYIQRGAARGWEAVGGRCRGGRERGKGKKGGRGNRKWGEKS